MILETILIDMMLRRVCVLQEFSEFLCPLFLKPPGSYLLPGQQRWSKCLISFSPSCLLMWQFVSNMTNVKRSLFKNRYSHTMHPYNWLKISIIMFTKSAQKEPRQMLQAHSSHMTRKSLQIYKWDANNTIDIKSTQFNVAEDIFPRINLCLPCEYMITMV